MKAIKILTLLSRIFAALTIAAMIYVLYNKGTVTAAYAVAPMLLSITFLSIAYNLKYKRNKNNKK